MVREPGGQKSSGVVQVAVPPAGVLWTMVLGAIALALAFSLAAILGILLRALSIIFVAIVFAHALSPLVERMARVLPRVAAILVLYLAFLVVLAGATITVLPPLIGQAHQALRDLPRFFSRLADLVNYLAPGTGTSTAHALEPRALDMVSNLVPSAAGVTLIGTGLVEVFFLSLYWLIALPGLRRYTLFLFPAERREHVDLILGKMGAALGGYVRGVALDAVVTGAISYVGLLLIGVKYPLILALITALAKFVPLIGPTIAEFLCAAIALLSSPAQAVIVLAFFLVLQQLSGNIILPFAIRSQVDVSPLLITAAVFVGLWAGGVIGGLIAIPVAALLQVVIVEIVTPAVRRWSGAA